MKALGRYPTNLRFRHNQVIRYQGELHKYRGRARDRERRHIFEADSQLRVDFNDDEILDLQEAGQLEILGENEAESAVRIASGLKPLSNWDAATENERAAVQRMLKYIRRWEHMGSPPRTEATMRLVIADVAEEERDQAPPSPRTLCRKVAVWIKSGGDVDSLLPNSSCSGNFDDRIDSGLKVQFRELIERYYLSDEPEPVVSAHMLAANDWEEAYRHLPADERPKFPSLSSAYSAVHEINLFTREFCRKGTAQAVHKFAPVDDGPVATRHNECWEMDHTTLDLIVVDEETALPIGRPTITLAIDRHSRAIPSFHIGWDAPGIHGVIECLRKGILRKPDIAGLQNPWPVFGVPDEIVTDNGAEFRSKALKEICARLGIEHSRSPVLKAWYRGRIERAIRTLVHSTCHTVPGTTYANFYKRIKDRIPERTAVCTLSQLEAIITRFVVDVYHTRRHRILNDSPIRIWNESVRLNPMKPLPDPQKLASALSLLYYRKAEPKGVVFEGLWYNSLELSTYRSIPGAPRIVSVKVDPNDITQVWFFNTLTNQHVELRVQKSMRDRIAGVSLAEHKMGRAIQRNNPELLAGEAGLAKAYALIRGALEERVRGRDGLTNKRRAMRVLDKLQKKSAAMFEDAPSYEPRREGDLADDLFGPEEIEDNDLSFPHGAIANEAAILVDPAPELTGENVKDRPAKRQRRPKDIGDEAGAKPAAQVQPKPGVLPVDDMDELEQAMQRNLYINEFDGEK